MFLVSKDEEIIPSFGLALNPRTSACDALRDAQRVLQRLDTRGRQSRETQYPSPTALKEGCATNSANSGPGGMRRRTLMAL